MVIIDSMTQGTDEWLMLRLGKLTASRFGDLMKSARKNNGISDTMMSYLYQLASELATGVPTPSFQNAATRWGNETEPQARYIYELKTGNEVREVAFVQHENPYIGMSPDGLIVGQNGGLEIKCPSSLTQMKRFLSNSGLPPEYYFQVHGQIWIGELDWVDFVSFDPRFGDAACSYICTRVYRDENVVKALSEKVLIAANMLEDMVSKSMPENIF